MLNQSESTNTKPVYLAQSDRKRIFEQRLRDQLLAGLSGDLDDVALPLVFTRGDKIKAIQRRETPKKPYYAFKAKIAGVDFVLYTAAGNVFDEVEGETDAVKDGSIAEAVLKCVALGQDEKGNRALVVLTAFWLIR